jgi:hypothetical protein
VYFCGGDADARKALAIQVLIITPQLGIFKGMLFRKRITFGPPIQLTRSMRKVGSSKHPDATNNAFMLLTKTGYHPNKTNHYQDSAWSSAMKIATPFLLTKKTRRATPLGPASTCVLTKKMRRPTELILTITGYSRHSVWWSIEDVNALIGKLCTLSEKTADESANFMSDPDAVAFAEAYNEALDIAKHGCTILLPEHLHEQVPPYLQKYLVSYR